MDLLEEITKEIKQLEDERNNKMFDAWVTNECKGNALKEAEKIKGKYDNMIRFLDNAKSMQETVINDFNYYKRKNNK